MTKLSDTQSIILSAAAQRADGNVLPLPGSLRGGAAHQGGGRAALPRPDPRARHRQPAQGGRGAEHGLAQRRRTAAACCSSSPPPALDAIGIEPEAVPYAFNEGTNSAGEPAAGAPTGADEAPVEAPAKRRGRPRKAAPTGADTARSAQDPRAAPSRRS